MPKLYKSDVPSEADLKVYVTDIRADADLIVFEALDAWAATEPWIWYYTEIASEADRVVSVTDSQWEADLVIYKTEIQFDAGWVDAAKSGLL